MLFPPDPLIRKRLRMPQLARDGGTHPNPIGHDLQLQVYTRPQGAGRQRLDVRITRNSLEDLNVRIGVPAYKFPADFQQRGRFSLLVIEILQIFSCYKIFQYLQRGRHMMRAAWNNPDIAITEGSRTRRTETRWKSCHSVMPDEFRIITINKISQKWSLQLHGDPSIHKGI